MATAVKTEYQRFQTFPPDQSDDSYLQFLNQRINELVLRLQNEHDVQTVRSLQHMLNIYIHDREQLLKINSDLKRSYEEAHNTSIQLMEDLRTQKHYVEISKELLQESSEIVSRLERENKKSENKFRNASYGLGAGAAAAKLCGLSPELAVVAIAAGAVGGVLLGNVVNKCPKEPN